MQGRWGIWKKKKKILSDVKTQYINIVVYFKLKNDTLITNTVYSDYQRSNYSQEYETKEIKRLLKHK